MKGKPKIGTEGTLAFKTEAKHAVDFAGNGMPAVLSTPNLIGFIERTARETLAPFLEDNERSVGVEVEIRHLAPTLVSGTVHCTARIIQVNDRKVDFQVEARDAHEVIAKGLHQRAVIRVESFNRRVQAKAG